jgi:hypothetical protein
MSQYDSDIAIAVLLKTLNFNTDDTSGKFGKVAGWGKTESMAVHTPSALHAPVNAIDNEDCVFTDRELLHFASRRTFCA